MDQQKGRTSNLKFIKGRMSNPAVASQIDDVEKEKVNTKKRKKSQAISEEPFMEEVWMFRATSDVQVAQCFGQAAVAQTKPHMATY